MLHMLQLIFFVSSGLMAGLFATSADCQPFRYMDAQGKVHYVDTLEKVPAEFRSQASSRFPAISKVPGHKISAPSQTAERRLPQVEIYVAEWCPLCVALEKYLRRHEVVYTRYDIERSVEGRQRYLALGGGGVPIIKIGDQVMRGYREADVAAALKIR